MSEIHEMAVLHRVDLNLLVAFDALVHERSVTKAARLAGVSQSAMSHTLRRLRGVFDDALLVRGGRGMVLTPRAEALAVPVRAGLLALGRVLTAPVGFAPATARRVFRLVSPDLFDILALPLLLPRLAAEAPGVDLTVVPRPAQLADALEAGDVDLAIVPVLLGPSPADLGDERAPGLRQRVLFRDAFRSYLRRDHPAFGAGGLTLARFAALDHVLVSPHGAGPGLVDAALAECGLSRRVALRVPGFATALMVAERSELVLTAPASLAAVAGAGLVQLPPPVTLPAHAVTMVWHPRYDEEPGLSWLRALVVDTLSGTAPAAG